MTIFTSLTAAESTVTESPPAPRLPRKSHQAGRQRRIRQSLQSALPDSDVIPEGHEANCMRFYKWSSGWERQQSGPAAVAMATAVAAARRPRKRRPRKRRAKRRPRSRGRASGALPASNCSKSDNAQDITVSSSPIKEGAVEEEAKQEVVLPAIFDHPMLTRLCNRTSTTYTRSSCTRSTASSILRNVSKDNDVIDADPYRMQYIFHGGWLRAVQVMKWPEKRRIPTTERYRHEEPMKRRYGRKSLLCRLVRGLELSHNTAGLVKASDFRRPIPLLPRRMIELTKSRLMLWYKPLESFGEFHAAFQTD